MRSMIPLGLFLLGLAAIYVGTVQAAFTALMRLPLRLAAARNDPSDLLMRYLEEPVMLFVPARIVQALILVLTGAMLSLLFDVTKLHGFGMLVLCGASFAVICAHGAPQLIVRTNPQAVIEFLLPSFRVLTGLLLPLTFALVGLTRRDRDAATGVRHLDGQPAEASRAGNGNGTNGNGAHEERDAETEAHGDERRMLQSIVGFGEILAREVMTPRPDIVAIKADKTVAALRALFREQQYSRYPVFNENLDNIAGFVLAKDLLLVEEANMDEHLVSTLIRPATFVPETKRVPDLLKEFQKGQLQLAIVVDEYGGTAGLVTIEDLLEEIVGEIRDEYDVETEPIVDEGQGVFVVSGKVDVDEVADRLGVDIEREGFETVGGYLLSHLGRVPGVGETFEVDDLTVEVLEAERRRIHKVRVRRKAHAASAGA
jgi:CBS domain containing-hemolysin-like protein